MLDSLQQLRNALHDRARAAAYLDSVTKKERKSKRDEAAIARRTERLASREASLAQARAAIEAELIKARQAEVDLRSKLREAQAPEPGGEPSGSDTRADERVLAKEVERAEARVRILEAASKAETTDEFDALLRRNAGVLAEEPRVFRPGAGGFLEWPGISFPDRFMSLVREVRRNPQTKKPIVISAAVVGALALMIFGLALVSSLRNTDSSTADLLGRGEMLVPVVVDGAVDTGTIELTIDYDSEILTAREVVPGGLAQGADIEYDVTRDGAVTLEVTSSRGISGSGELVFIIYRANQISIDPVTLTLSHVAVRSLEGDSDLPVDVEDGWADTTILTSRAPVLHVQQAG